MALLCAVLLLGCGSAFAAAAGSASDPLLSKSYVLQWEEMLLADRSAKAIGAAAPIVTDAARSLAMLRVRCGANGAREAAIPRGARAALSSGDSITLRSGSGSLQISGGAVIDVTAGSVFSGGAAPLCHRLILADGAKARVGAHSGTMRVDRTRTDGLVGVWVACDGDCTANAKLVLGESVYVTAETDPAEAPVACVPSTAVFRDGVTPSVFVRDEHDEDLFVVKPVVPGRSAAGWTAVTGLDADDEVVSQGVYELRHALPAVSGEKKAAGHFHADGTFHADGEDKE